MQSNVPVGAMGFLGWAGLGWYPGIARKGSATLLCRAMHGGIGLPHAVVLGAGRAC